MQWNIAAGLGFLASTSFTIFMAYRMEFHTRVPSLTNQPTDEIWFMIFGWAGCLMYVVGTVFAYGADKSSGIDHNLSEQNELEDVIAS